MRRLYLSKKVVDIFGNSFCKIPEDFKAEIKKEILTGIYWNMVTNVAVEIHECLDEKD